jgi:hypothetical protein
VTTTQSPFGEEPVAGEPTTGSPRRYPRGVRIKDRGRFETLKRIEDFGATWSSPSYPIVRTGGVSDLGMGGNGPDETFTINGGNPCGDCVPNVVPKNAGQTTAGLGGETETAWSSDRVGRLYFLFQALTTAGCTWRPPALGAEWTERDVEEASKLDVGVDPETYLNWICTHDEGGKEVAVGDGLLDGFVAVDLKDLDAALGTADAVLLAVDLNDAADQQFDDWQSGTNPNGWDLPDGEKADPNDGHGVLLAASTSPTGPRAAGTWSAFIPLTGRWLNGCFVQAFAILTKETCESKSLPWEAIADDIEAGGGVTVKPTDTPPVTPPVSPPAPDPVPPAPTPPVPSPPGPMPKPPIPTQHNWYDVAEVWWKALVAYVRANGGPDLGGFGMTDVDPLVVAQQVGDPAAAGAVVEP